MNEADVSERKAREKEMIKTAILDAPGVVLVGLALYAKFGANGEPFHPILKNELVVAGMFIVGGAIMLWGVWRSFAIVKRRLGPGELD